MQYKLTIGMAVYDDFDGLYFTIQSIRLFHPEVLNEVEFIVVDNNPDSAQGRAVKDFVESWVRHARYVPFTEVRGTAAPREQVFQLAKGEFMLCMDPHVMLWPGALRRLLDYFASVPESRDLVHGPMLNDDCQDMHATHMDPVWRSEMYGIWAKDERGTDLDSAPFEIPMHGLGVFACRKAAWPGFNPRFRGFGGEEGYIHEKFRRAGAKTLCLPFFRWLHRFGRPASVPYTLTRDDKLRNYLIGWRELNLDTSAVVDHFQPLMPQSSVRRIVAEVETYMPANVQPAAVVAVVQSTAVETSREPPLVNSPVPGGMVSCLMATYGRWSKVCEALACFLAQDYPRKELIILNNHPQPLTFDHPDVRIVNEPGYPNLGACRNRLLELALGEFVRTWDDDDLYLPWAISQGVAHIGQSAAFKPRRSWFWQGQEGFRLCENVLEASWTVRAEVARKYRYKEAGGDEHEPLSRGIAREGGIRMRDFGPYASYVYRWGHGMHHISGTLGRADGLAARTAEWTRANQDDGGGRPLQPADLSPYWEKLSLYCDLFSSEIKLRAARLDPQTTEKTSGDRQLNRIVDLCFPDRQGLVAAEFGRLRTITPEGRGGDGLSTCQLARDPRVRKLYSFDPSTETIDTCRQVISEEALGKVGFYESLQQVPSQDCEAIDLLLIDTDDDSLANLQCLAAIKARLSNIAAIAVGGYSGGKKHVLIRASLEPTHTARIVGDCIVFQPRAIPEYLVWDIFARW